MPQMRLGAGRAEHDLRRCVPCNSAAPVAATAALHPLRAKVVGYAGVRAYLKGYRADSIIGWLAPADLMAFLLLAHVQHAAGVAGAVGEIGVHHGKSFLPAALAATTAEPLWVADVFDKQELNIGKSGGGSWVPFVTNLATVGLSEANVTVHVGSSLDLGPSYACDAGLPRFRFFSVDGGHFAEAVLHDMTFAACHLEEGGIVAVDDVWHPGWLGVFQGVSE